MPPKRPRRHGGAAAKQGLESDSGVDRRRGSSMRLFRHELRSQMRLYGRSRELAFFTFALPLIMFFLLGSVYGNDRIKAEGNVRAADYLLAGMLGYGAIATGFAGLSIMLVIRRESGILKRVRATPLPAWAYVVALLCTTLIAFALEAVCMIAIGRIFFHTHVPNLFSLAHALPLVYMIRLVRDIAIHNQQIWNRPGDVAVIAAWGLAGAIFAARRFRWEPQEG